MGQYFEKEPQSASNVFSFTYFFQQKKYTFTSDNGVFSKKQVDYGTHVLLKSIITIPFSTALDMGCGIGIIGICLGRENPNAQIEMADINRRSLQLAEDNIHKNEVKNCIVIESNLYQNLTSQYDLIVSNPPIRAGKKTVHQIVEEAIFHLKENGSIAVVIQKKQGAMSLYKKMEEIFGNIEVLSKDKGYYVLVSVLQKKDKEI